MSSKKAKAQSKETIMDNPAEPFGEQPKTEPVSDVYNTSDLSDLPEPLRKKVEKSLRRATYELGRSGQFYSILSNADRPLTITEVMVVYYRLYGIELSRPRTNAVLTAMVTNGKAERIGRAQYTVLNSTVQKAPIETNE